MAFPNCLRSIAVKRIHVCSLQDLKIHHSEILGKFVAIMRERLTASLRQLPAAASQWRYSAESAQGQQQYTPSPFAASLTKQLRILSQVPKLSAAYAFSGAEIIKLPLSPADHLLWTSADFCPDTQSMAGQSAGLLLMQHLAFAIEASSNWLPSFIRQ